MTAADFRRIALSLEGVEEAPEIFLPIPGGWGKMGHTIFAWWRRAKMYRCTPNGVETAH